MMAPVPPLTVRMPATFRITSLGELQPESLPVSFTPITLIKWIKTTIKNVYWYNFLPAVKRIPQASFSESGRSPKHKGENPEIPQHTHRGWTSSQGQLKTDHHLPTSLNPQIKKAGNKFPRCQQTIAELFEPAWLQTRLLVADSALHMFLTHFTSHAPHRGLVFLLLLPLGT